MKEYQVPTKYIGVRVDRYLRKEYPQLSLGDVFKSLRTGKVRVNKKKVKEDYRFLEEDIIQDYLLEGEKKEKSFLTLSSTEKENIEAQIFYQDEEILILDKKAGELMHKGSSHEYGLAEMLQGYFQNEDFHFVNRLDRGTSGLVLAGKSLPVIRNLSKKIKEGTIEKKYYIIVEGVPKKKEFFLVTYLKKEEEKVKASQEQQEDYKECRASFRVLEQRGRYALLEANLETGRTHQLRVQLAEIGHPIVGDTKYGKTKGKRMYLHSHRLEFLKEEKEWDTGVPQDFLLYLKQK